MMIKQPYIKSLLGSVILLLAALAVIAARPQARHASLAAAWPTLQLQPVAYGFQRPIYVTHANDGSGRLFVVQQDGQIRILHTNGDINANPFLDISGRVRSPADNGGNEEGLLGLAFPPGYTQEKYFYVYYTNSDGNN